MSKPPKVVIPGLNRGVGIPAGYMVGRRKGKGKGPAELLDLSGVKEMGVATSAQVVQTAAALSTAVSTAIQSISPDIMMGESGEDGQPGPPGQPGATGPAGAAGSAGAAGVAGPPGFALDGLDGEEGMPIPGASGAPGAAGAPGPQGPLGFGLDGQDGEDGMPGGPYVNRGGDTMTGPLTITGVAAPLTAANTGICEATISGQSRTRFVVTRYSSDAFSNSNLVQKARGTISAPSAVVTNDAVGLCESVAYGTSGFKPVAKIQSFVVAATPSDTDMESEISVEVVPSGSVTSTQIALFRYATGLTMYGTNVVIDQNSLVNLRSYATGSLPTAGTPGRLAYDSTAGAPKYDTGAAWALFGGSTGPQGATGLLGPMGMDGQDGEEGMAIPGVPGAAGAAGGLTPYIAVPSFRGNSGQVFTFGNCGGHSITIPVSCTIKNIVVFVATANGSAQVAPAIYSIDGAGNMNALLAQGSLVTGMAFGINTLPLTSPLVVTKGQTLWICVQVLVSSLTIAATETISGGYFAAAGALPSTAAVGPYGSLGIAVWPEVA